MIAPTLPVPTTPLAGGCAPPSDSRPAADRAQSRARVRPARRLTRRVVLAAGRSQNKTAAETCLRCRELLSAGVEGLIPCKTSGWARSFLGLTSRAWLFQEIQQAFVNRVMIRLVPGDLSSVSQDLHSAFGVLAPSAFAGIEATRCKSRVREREGRMALGDG